jgi:hypothetical protein
MCRSLIVGPGVRPGLAAVVALSILGVGLRTAAAQDRSPIVLNCDGAGTTVVKELPDSSFQVQQLWTNNSVNGIQAFTDGSFAFVNCTPTVRTLQELELSCRIFDEALGTWGEPPVVSNVPADFLDGDFANPYDSLFGVTGEYLTVFEAAGESYSFRFRFLQAALTAAGFPVLLGESNPETRSAFLLRDVDVPGGATDVTNFSLGVQVDDLCLDFDLNPTAPGGTLAGSLQARALLEDGSCGDPVGEERLAAFVPSGSVGEAGATCPYRVLEIGGCSPLTPFEVGSTICLPCTGACEEPNDDIDIVLANTFNDASAYVDCRDVVVELDEDDDPRCGAECEDGLPAIFFSPGSNPGLSEAVGTFLSRR